MTSPLVTITGTIFDLTGVANAGKIVFTLANFGGAIPKVTGTMLAPVSQTVQAAGDGTFSVSLYTNAQVLPAGTYYQITVYGANGSMISTAAYQFNNPGSYDLSSLNSMVSAPARPPAFPVVINTPNTQVMQGPLTAPTLSVASALNQTMYQTTQNPTVNYRVQNYWSRYWNSPTLNLTQSNENVFFGIDDTALAGGFNFGNEYGAAGNKTTWMGYSLRHKGYTPGQHNVHGVSNECYSIGDAISHYVFGYHYGGQANGSDEGLEGVWMSLTQGTVAYAGTLTAAGLGAAAVTVNNTQGSGKQGEGRFLINLSKASGAGVITTIAGTGPVLYTGSGTGWPVSTSTTTSTAITVTPGAASPGSVTIQVGSTAGMTTNSLVCVADAACFEMVVPTAIVDGTHFTATFRKPHPTGTIVAWGGLCGSFVELTADRWTAATNGVTPPLRQVWPIIASPSATTMQVWISVHGMYDTYSGQAVVSAGSNAYSIYPGAEVTSVQVNGAVSDTLGLAPNSVNWQVGDSVEQPLYPALMLPGNNWGFTRYFPSQGVAGGGGLSMSFSGIWANGDAFLKINNTTPVAYYSGFGGTLLPPVAAVQVLGSPTRYGLYLSTAPATAAIYSGCYSGGCSQQMGLFQVQNDTNQDNFTYQNGTWRFTAAKQTINFALDNTYGFAVFGSANAILSMFGATSGHASIGVAAAAGTPSTFLMPVTDPTVGQVLTAATPSGGTMQTSWVSPPVVSAAAQYALPFYSAAGTASTLGGSNIVTDATKNNLTVPGQLFTNTGAGGKATALGGLSGSETAFAGLWLGATDRAASDYAVLSDGTTLTAVNCPSGGTVDFRGANATWGQVSVTGFQCPGGGVGRGYFAAEGSAPTGVASQDVFYADSTAHRWKMKNNNGAADTVVGAATTDAFTNKTFDTAGTGNVFKIGGQTVNPLTGTATLTFTAIAAQTSQEQTITVSGASATNFGVVASPRATLGNVNLTWAAWVSGANTITVRVTNPTTGSITPSAVAWGVTVIQ